MEIAGVRERKTRTTKQIELAQYFTPQSIATYMTSLFEEPNGNTVRILDPGAGEGILGSTLVDRFKSKVESINADFVEVDTETSEKLSDNLERKYGTGSRVAFNVKNEDFIDQAVTWHSEAARFTHIIINPPYFKLRVDSKESNKLRENGISVTNIYAAFIWLSIKLLKSDGELVAIIPRSFCNGPYFLKFRQYMLRNCSLEKIHIFNLRDKAFSGDGVLQENVIIHLKKRKQAEKVQITYSSDHDFTDLIVSSVPSESVIHPDDDQKVIHIPAAEATTRESVLFEDKLEETGLNVSTGPVVDFRLKDYIFESKTSSGMAPLIYPAHMKGDKVDWPLSKINKKGQYFNVTEETKKWVVPLDGFHVIVRRFSSKEERRRIFASIVDPDKLKTTHVAYENHVNFYHIKKSGLDKDLALGLCAFLNSKIVDDYFRSFSGHTQVNVSDLKRLRYPRPDTLRQIGVRLRDTENLDEQAVNEVIGSFA